MKDPRGLLDPLVLLVNEALQAQLVLLASQADLDLKDPQDPPERKVDRERKDLKAQLVEMAFRDP